MDRQRAGGNDDAAGQGTIGLAFHVSTGAGFLVFIARCLAPLVGAVIGSLVSISEHYLLALYAGFFLSMGATDLLPEAHSHPSWKRVALTIAGFAITFAIARAAT